MIGCRLAASITLVGCISFASRPLIGPDKSQRELSFRSECHSFDLRFLFLLVTPDNLSFISYVLSLHKGTGTRDHHCLKVVWLNRPDLVRLLEVGRYEKCNFFSCPINI